MTRRSNKDKLLLSYLDLAFVHVYQEIQQFSGTGIPKTTSNIDCS